MKISNADGLEFEQAVTVPTATLDGHAINKGQADGAYAPIGGGGVTDHGALTGLADDDHTQYAILTPATSARNTIQPAAADKIPLILKAFASQTADLMQWQSSAGAALAAVDASGRMRTGVVGAGALTHQFEVQAGHINFVSVANAGACSAALAGVGGGNVDNGAHRYKVTFVTAFGETSVASATWASVTVVDKTADGQVALTNIPTSADSTVTSRKIYRSKAGDTTSMYLLTTIANNTATTYTDNTADSGLSGSTAHNLENSTAGKILLNATRILEFAGNNAIGGWAAGGNPTGSDNSIWGTSAAGTLTSGRWNTGIGAYALYSTTTGSGRTGLGRNAGYSSNGDRCVYLGYEAGYYDTVSYRLFIDYDKRASAADALIKSLIYGEFHTNPVSQLLRTNAVFQVLMTDAATNAATTIRKSNHNTTGTAANGFGSRDLWQLESSTTENQDAAALDVVWSDATHATRKADLVLSAFDTAIREGLRIRANGSAPAIGFLGAAPVAQAAHIADAKTDYAAGDLDGEAEIISAINTLNGKINAILAVLENVGLVATA